MITRVLVNHSLKVIQLGDGSRGLRGPRAWGVGGVSDADADRILNAVVDAGINLIDTAPDYGISEERIGRLLEGRRTELILATKCGCVFTPQEGHLQLEHLIKLLQSFRQRGLVKFPGVSSSLPNLSALVDLHVFEALQRSKSVLRP